METRPADTELTLALLMTPGVGARSLTRWLEWSAAEPEGRGSWVGRRLEDLLMRFPPALENVALALSDLPSDRLEEAARLTQRTTASGGQILLASDNDYPVRLRVSLDSARPPFLTVFGDAEVLARAGAGIVGTRSPSETARSLAGYCASWCAEQDIAVVSGGAQGIDLMAHEGAVRAGGSTVVVLPQGLLSYRIPAFLAPAVEEGRAALVSEFVPRAGWTTHGAVTRNATIAALSRFLCVLEPRETGGSVKTGRDALAQGKSVLVYGGVAGRQGERELVSRGAGPLLGRAGRFDARALHDAWNGAPRGARQSELF